jgi:copper(I)-binding protein
MTMKRVFLSFAFSTLLFALAAPSAWAGHEKLGDLMIGDSWARATAKLAKSGAAYLTITNQGSELDLLVAVESPVAKKAELHTVVNEEGVMKMRPLKAVEIHPGEPAVLAPGGIHIMLMGLSAPLIEGTSFPLTLTFEKAGTLEIEVPVHGPGAMGHEEPMKHDGHMNHGEDHSS